jgi:catechol 2,3-dioxygenase-like lactoylglutathione lyase family enzyme
MSLPVEPPVLQVHHGGISVSDMDASLRFYRDGLGLEVTLDAIRDAPYLHEALAVPFSALRYVLLGIPGAQAGAIVELLEYRDAERMPAAARPQDPGNGHLCLQVRDAAALHARLRDLGYRSRSPETVPITAGGNAGGRIVYIADPDGYWVELLERPRSTAP